jgi:hypothetical protein
MDNRIKKIATDFHNDMQELVNNGDVDKISVKMGDGDWQTIAEKKLVNESIKQPKTTSNMAKIETLNLKCVLTDEEIMAVSKEMAEHINKKKQAEDNLASFLAQLKAEIKGHDSFINKDAVLINSGHEYRNVKCEVVIDEKANKVVWVREDTGEICQTESPIPLRYLQKEIDLND